MTLPAWCRRPVSYLVMGLVAWLALTGVKLHLMKGKYQAAALRGDSLEAANDRQRAMWAAGVLVQARRIVQLTIEKDSVDRALHVESRARYRLGVQVADLTAKLAARVDTTPEGTRTATFHQRTVPYTIDATAALPAPPATGTLDVRVALDPIELRGRVGCGAAVAGVRPATFYAEGPSWARLSLLALEQDPAVCNAAKGLPAPGWKLPWWMVPAAAGLGTLAGVLLGAWH